MKHSSSWRSPSNIALVKYWGKYENQLPANPSISFTLSNCHTETKVVLLEKNKDELFAFDVYLDGEKQESFKEKIHNFFISIVDEARFLQDYHINILTKNSFPHSSGIASSASGMSALALALLTLKEELTGDQEEDFYQKASEWARLGSGSASRSVYGSLVEWGKHEGTIGSNDRFAIPYQGAVAPVFKKFRDYVLLVETGSKSVSSTAGHSLMQEHPFAPSRFKQAHKNLSKLYPILKEGNLDDFGQLVESEALTLHAMMMTSNPYFILMKPNTVHILNKVWRYRMDTKNPLFFTLDAGANVHLLFPEEIEHSVSDFVKEALTPHLKNGQYICDHVGDGPKQLKADE